MWPLFYTARCFALTAVLHTTYKHEHEFLKKLPVFSRKWTKYRMVVINVDRGTEISRTDQRRSWSITRTHRWLRRHSAKISENFCKAKEATRNQEIKRQFKLLTINWVCRSKENIFLVFWLTNYCIHRIHPHPLYSPDLAPTDYHLFRSLAYYFREKKFDEEDDLKTDLTNFFGQKSKKFYKRGILSLPERWQQVVDNNRAYFIET